MINEINISLRNIIDQLDKALNNCDRRLVITFQGKTYDSLPPLTLKEYKLMKRNKKKFINYIMAKVLKDVAKAIKEEDESLRADKMHDAWDPIYFIINDDDKIALNISDPYAVEQFKSKPLHDSYSVQMAKATYYPNAQDELLKKWIEEKDSDQS